MSEPSNSLLLRFARWQVRALVRVWPEESRKWGQALASEAEEIQLPLEAVRWALGGVVVFSRALGSHLLAWCKLPVGGQSSAGLGPLTNAPGPRRSRLFTAAILIAAALLLCIPEGREATATLRATWLWLTQLARIWPLRTGTATPSVELPALQDCAGEAVERREPIRLSRPWGSFTSAVETLRSSVNDRTSNTEWSASAR